MLGYSNQDNGMGKRIDTQINRAEREYKINPHNIVNRFLTKEQRQFGGERIVFSINGAGTIGYPYEKEVNSDTDLTIYRIINSEWIIDLNVKCKTETVIKENIGENLYDLGFGNEF